MSTLHLFHMTGLMFFGGFAIFKMALVLELDPGDGDVV